MGEWTTVPEMVRSIRRNVLILSGSLLLLAILAGDMPSAFGLAVGTALSLWQFTMLCSSTSKAVRMPKLKAQGYAGASYIVRYSMVALVLGMTYFTQGISFPTAVFGLLSVKLVIVGGAVRQAFRAGGAAYLKQIAPWRGRREGETNG